MNPLSHLQFFPYPVCGATLGGGGVVRETDGRSGLVEGDSRRGEESGGNAKLSREDEKEKKIVEVRWTTNLLA